MNGPIAQVVALALHGNAFLAGGNSANFIAQNSTAIFCQSVVFTQEEPTWFGLGKPAKIMMLSPNAWFDDLKRRKVVRIGVRWTSGKNQGAPDRMLSAFVGGGGTWTLQVQLPDGNFEQWVAQWDVDESRRNTDRKIWKVNYRRAYVGKDSLRVANLADSKEQLKHALTDVHAFASRKDLKPFTGMFVKALAALNEEAGAETHHKDLFPPNSGSRSARATLQAAQHAWVFGGMGSWNDIGFDGDRWERIRTRIGAALSGGCSSDSGGCGRPVSALVVAQCNSRTRGTCHVIRDNGLAGATEGNVTY